MPPSVSVHKRRRGVLRHLPHHLQGIDLTDHYEAFPDSSLPPEGFTPTLSPDTALTAFAQLAAIRLNADRGIISLIDDKKQYIIAESTPTTRLRATDRHASAPQLWLGNIIAPRSRLVCPHVLDVDASGHSHNKSGWVPDLSEDDRCKELAIVKGSSGFRFYAGALLQAHDGFIVGSVCVFSAKPRHNLAEEDLGLLEDIAATVVEHLATQELRKDNEIGERMVRGLINFVDGATELQTHYGKSEVPNDMVSYSDKYRPVRPKITAENKYNQSQSAPSSYTGIFRSATEDEVPKRPNLHRSTTSIDRPTKPTSAKKQLQESNTPERVKLMFSRAANIIRETSDLSGVILFDTSVAAMRDSKDGLMSHKDGFSNTSSSSSDRDSTEMPDHEKWQNRTSTILGFSLEYQENVPMDEIEEALHSMPESVLLSILKKFPSGKIFNINLNGELSTSDDSDSTVGESIKKMSVPVTPNEPVDSSRPRILKRPSRLQRIGEALQKLAPNALSIVCLPLWDHDRNRWYAMAVGWSKRNERTLSPDRDLLYLKAFGNSVMTEVSRLDQIASNQTKSTFIASISHELRSPLHGILGGVEFLQGSDLDMFQKSMLHSISTCGHTLLDTLSHVLDFADVSQINKRRRRSVQRKLIGQGSRRTPNDVTPLLAAVDLSTATEQVVEAIFASQSYRVIQKASGHFDGNSKGAPNNQWSASAIAQSNEDRKLTRVVLDIPPLDNWKFRLSPGAWGRLIMNILGNALKYTQSGHVRVSLSADSSKSTKKGTTINLTVSDTGVGMSQEFLTNKLFVPFAQEDTLSSGIGLGLSIVRHITDSLHGKIDIESKLGEGTTVKVRVSLPKADSASPTDDDGEIDSIHTIKERLEGRRICILKPRRIETPDEETLRQYTASDLLVEALDSTLSKWLGMQIISTNEWYDHAAELVVVVEPSFEYLAAIREKRAHDGKCPITIFLAIDAIEAAALRADARVLSKESVVEICTQPCGPYKMAKLLDHCLNRYQDEDLETIGMHLSPTDERRNRSPIANDSTVEVQATTPSHDTSSKSQRLSYNDSPSSPDHIKSPSEGRPTSPAFPVAKTLSKRSPKLKKSYPVPNKNTHRLHVLIVDDNAINRRLLVAFCKRYHLDYTEASDGLQAVNHVKAHHGPLDTQNHTGDSVFVQRRFDLILMDLSMPVMDGMTATREIRAVERTWHQQHQSQQHQRQRSESDASLKSVYSNPVYIIALTGLASVAAKFEAMESGIDMYMTKPVNFERLQEMIDRCVVQHEVVKSPSEKSNENDVSDTAKKDEKSEAAATDDQQQTKDLEGQNGSATPLTNGKRQHVDQHVEQHVE